jgi:hypothetical protein
MVLIWAPVLTFPFFFFLKKKKEQRTILIIFIIIQLSWHSRDSPVASCGKFIINWKTTRIQIIILSYNSLCCHKEVQRKQEKGVVTIMLLLKIHTT